MSPLKRLWNVLRRDRLDDELGRRWTRTLHSSRTKSAPTAPAHRRRGTRARFGNPLVHRERALDGVMATSVESAWKEMGFAARRLLRSPAFSVAAVLTLALAIGANAAIFAVVQRVLLN